VVVGRLEIAHWVEIILRLVVDQLVELAAVAAVHQTPGANQELPHVVETVTTAVQAEVIRRQVAVAAVLRTPSANQELPHAAETVTTAVQAEVIRRPVAVGAVHQMPGAKQGPLHVGEVAATSKMA
jgi:hypothetical protein